MTEEAKDWVTRIAPRARDFSSIVLPLLTILGMIWGSAWLLKDNTRFQKGLADTAGVTELRAEVAGLRSAIEANTAQQLQLTSQLLSLNEKADERSKQASLERDALKEELTDRLHKLEDALKVDQSAEPAVRYMDFGNSVTALQPGAPIRIGELVRITWHLIKLKDCGRPTLADFILDQHGVRAQLTDVSSRDAEGHGANFQPDPQTMREITYTARIPGDKGLTAGGAQITINASFDKMVCPRVNPVESKPTYFELSPAR